MNTPQIHLSGAKLTPLPSGVLWWAAERLLAVGDLHLGKAERVARLGGTLLPPYETIHTLNRLEAEVAETAPSVIVLLGDSFDDMAAASDLAADVVERLGRLAAGRRLVWIAGNHDPGPVELPGSHLASYRHGPLVFRHIAEADGEGEISAHYHPKARLFIRGSRIARPCFLADAQRVILPAFGTYTGGLDISAPVLDALMGPDAVAYLTGRRVTALPFRMSTQVS